MNRDFDDRVTQKGIPNETKELSYRGIEESVVEGHSTSNSSKVGLHANG